MMDDIADQQDLSNEISNAISNPVGFGDDMDEDELEKELEALEEEALEEKLVEVPHPHELPAVPTGEIARPKQKASKNLFQGNFIFQTNTIMYEKFYYVSFPIKIFSYLKYRLHKWFFKFVRFRQIYIPGVIVSHAKKNSYVWYSGRKLKFFSTFYNDNEKLRSLHFCGSICVMFL